MPTILTFDPNPKLRGRALLLDLIWKQRRWIERCEANRVSYAGPNGPAIRRADEARLRELEARLAKMPERGSR